MSFLSLQEIIGYAALLFVNVNHCFITLYYRGIFETFAGEYSVIAVKVLLQKAFSA